MIAIDCRVVGNNTGIDYYTRDLVNSFEKIGVKNQILLLIANRFQENFFQSFKNKKLIPAKKVLIDHLQFFQRLKNENVTAVLHPDNTAFLSDHSNNVVILHDVLPWTKREAVLSSNFWLQLKQNLYFFLQMEALKKARKIVTVSRFSEQEVSKVVKNMALQIEMVPEAVSEIFSKQPAVTKKDWLKNFPNVTTYCFYIGGFEKNKNVPTLLKAFDQADYTGHLILGGDIDSYPEKASLNIQVSQMKKKDKIIFINYVDTQNLPTWYYYADFFVYPPFYGGFGRPILEAIKTGCPVISSGTTSFPEVGGPDCFYFDPNNSEELTVKINEMTKILAKPLELAILKEKLKKQASKFSWEQSAQRIWQIVNQ